LGIRKGGDGIAANKGVDSRKKKLTRRRRNVQHLGDPTPLSIAAKSESRREVGAWEKQPSQKEKSYAMGSWKRRGRKPRVPFELARRAP